MGVYFRTCHTHTQSKRGADSAQRTITRRPRDGPQGTNSLKKDKVDYLALV